MTRMTWPSGSGARSAQFWMFLAQIWQCGTPGPKGWFGQNVTAQSSVPCWIPRRWSWLRHRTWYCWCPCCASCFMPFSLWCWAALQVLKCVWHLLPIFQKFQLRFQCFRCVFVIFWCSVDLLCKVWCAASLAQSKRIFSDVGQLGCHPPGS